MCGVSLTMNDETVDDLLGRVLTDDDTAVNQLLGLHRSRLKSMIRIRLNPRLRQRVDESDILQDALVAAGRNLRDYAEAPKLPFYVWLRRLAGLKILEAHRHHLGSDKRDAFREVPLHGGCPGASSVQLAADLSANLSSPSQAAMRNEGRRLIQECLEEMDEVDREVLVLRHFEQLSTSETAKILGLSKSATGSRYLRALSRLREIMERASS